MAIDLLSDNDTKVYDVSPVLLSAVGGQMDPALKAPWSGAVWGQYVPNPIIGSGASG